MPKFPQSENDVVALAELMIAGYTANPADFPSIDPLTDLVALQAALDAYQADRTTQDAAKSQAQIATVAKMTKLDELADLMKNDLKLSEVDTAAVPEKLTEIGWAPRQQPQPVAVPGQPLYLRPTAEGQGTCRLAWDRPVSGGPIRNYIIQRNQQPAGGGAPGEWEIVGTALNNQINLTDQPRGIQMNYRVMAANVAGESAPSNIAPVVL